MSKQAQVINARGSEGQTGMQISECGVPCVDGNENSSESIPRRFPSSNLQASCTSTKKKRPIDINASNESSPEAATSGKKKRRISTTPPTPTSRSNFRRSRASTRSSSIIKTPERSTSSSNSSGRPSKRTYKGKVDIYETCLWASDGTARVKGAVWPKKPKPTTQNVISLIQCDLCKGWLHWACSGLADGLDMEDEEWFCAECQTSIDSGLKDRVVEFVETRCVRPGCILRDHKAIKKWEQEDEIVYLVERFIGRRKVGNGFEYLVQWESWDIADSTWEPELQIDCVERHISKLVDDLEEEKKDHRKTGVLLKEAEGVIASGQVFMTAAEWAEKYCG